MEQASPQILVVDDNPAHRLLVRRALSKSGIPCLIIEASSVREATAALNSSAEGGMNWSIMIVDLNLGSEKGTALISAIRKNPKLRTVPVLMISTSALEQDIFEAYREGVQCFITKNDNVALFSADLASAVRLLLALNEKA